MKNIRPYRPQPLGLGLPCLPYFSSACIEVPGRIGEGEKQRPRGNAGHPARFHVLVLLTAQTAS